MRLEDPFALCYQQIYIPSRGRGARFSRGFNIRMKWRGTVRRFLLVLNGELLSYCRVMQVIDVASRSQINHAEDYEGRGQHGDWPAPRPALQAAIKEGQKEKQHRKKARHDDYSEYNLWSFPELEPLEHGQVIPLRPGEKMRVCTVRDRPQACRMEIGQDAQSRYDDQCEGHVHDHLARIKSLRSELRLEGVLVHGTSRPSPAEQDNMRTDEYEDCCWNQEDVRDIEARQRVANEGYLADDVGSHGSCKIGLLVPREQVASEAHAKNEE